MRTKNTVGARSEEVRVAVRTLVTNKPHWLQRLGCWTPGRVRSETEEMFRLLPESAFGSLVKKPGKVDALLLVTFVESAKRLPDEVVSSLVYHRNPVVRLLVAANTGFGRDSRMTALTLPQPRETSVPDSTLGKVLDGVGQWSFELTNLVRGQLSRGIDWSSLVPFSFEEAESVLKLPSLRDHTRTAGWWSPWNNGSDTAPSFLVWADKVNNPDVTGMSPSGLTGVTETRFRDLLDRRESVSGLDRECVDRDLGLWWAAAVGCENLLASDGFPLPDRQVLESWVAGAGVDNSTVWLNSRELVTPFLDGSYVRWRKDNPCSVREAELMLGCFRYPGLLLRSAELVTELERWGVPDGLPKAAADVLARHPELVGASARASGPAVGDVVAACMSRLPGLWAFSVTPSVTRTYCEEATGDPRVGYPDSGVGVRPVASLGQLVKLNSRVPLADWVDVLGDESHTRRAQRVLRYVSQGVGSGKFCVLTPDDGWWVWVSATDKIPGRVGVLAPFLEASRLVSHLPDETETWVDERYPQVGWEMLLAAAKADPELTLTEALTILT